jgi:hypothetical protein
MAADPRLAAYFRRMESLEQNLGYAAPDRERTIIEGTHLANRTGALEDLFIAAVALCDSDALDDVREVPEVEELVRRVRWLVAHP